MSTDAPTQAALDTLAFAEKMCRIVRKDRAEKLAGRRITRERHDRDIGAAEALLRLAKQEIINDAPLN